MIEVDPTHVIEKLVLRIAELELEVAKLQVAVDAKPPPPQPPRDSPMRAGPKP